MACKIVPLKKSEKYQEFVTFWSPVYSAMRDTLALPNRGHISQQNSCTISVWEPIRFSAMTYIISRHLTSLVGSATLSEMAYNETNFITGQLIEIRVNSYDTSSMILLNETILYEDLQYPVRNVAFSPEHIFLPTSAWNDLKRTTSPGVVFL